MKPPNQDSEREDMRTWLQRTYEELVMATTRTLRYLPRAAAVANCEKLGAIHGQTVPQHRTMLCATMQTQVME